MNLPYAGDPGGDGLGSFRTGGDAFAFALGYYEGDYKPINPNVTVSDGRDKPWDAYKDIRGTTAAQGLYNGNISWMSTDLPGLGESRMQAMVYGYDQLHRIVQARSLSTYDQNGLTKAGNQYDVDYSYDPNGNLLSLQRQGETTLRDELTYEYYAFSNKLKNVDGSEDENYTYDEIGNLIADEEEGIAEIQWTPYGKVRKVIKDDNSEIQFRYDASGNRIAKITATDTTVYARDASGNVMAVYKGKELEEQSIYGSSRLGLVNYASKTGYRSLGGKKYELSNHLGNVLAVVSDNIHLDQDSTWTSLINTTDYYPFGLAMDGRSEQDSSYRYGFNGKELDGGGEWGGQNNYDYGFRIYNPRIAKFLSVDPLVRIFPDLTSYQFASNRPIIAVDLDGLESKDVSGDIKGPNDKKEKSDEAFISPYVIAKKKVTEKVVAHGIVRTSGQVFLGTAGWILSVLSLSDDTRREPITLQYEQEKPKSPDSNNDPNENDRVTLFRGVPSTIATSFEGKRNPAYPPALLGVAVPRGGTDDPILANKGVPSNYTFWTTNKELAEDFATNGDEVRGVLLTKQFPKEVLQNNSSPDRYGEGEVQIPGFVTGATPTIISPKK